MFVCVSPFSGRRAPNIYLDWFTGTCRRRLRVLRRGLQARPGVCGQYSLYKRGAAPDANFPARCSSSSGWRVNHPKEHCSYIGARNSYPSWRYRLDVRSRANPPSRSWRRKGVYFVKALFQHASIAVKSRRCLLVIMSLAA